MCNISAALLLAPVTFTTAFDSTGVNDITLNWRWAMGIKDVELMT
jgi:hypothetical protein